LDGCGGTSAANLRQLQHVRQIREQDYMAKSKASDAAPAVRASSGGSSGGALARILTILFVNVILLAVAIGCAYSSGNKLPDLSPSTFAVNLLPISAAMGMILACRRIDFSLPVVLVLAIGLQDTHGVFSNDTFLRTLTVCGIAGGIGLLSAAVTWYGRIASALWTGIFAFGLWLLMSALRLPTDVVGPWPWPWAVGLSVGLLAAGALVLGATGLVSLPSSPPIIRTGSAGFMGLALAWVIAGAAVALASHSSMISVNAEDLPRAFPRLLAAAALGGAFILRGKWGMLTAVVLTCVAHLAWSYVASDINRLSAWDTDLGNHFVKVLVPAAAPLVAIPLYLAIDWLIRRRTGESAPTGLLA
jgi:hypothetical protein